MIVRDVTPLGQLERRMPEAGRIRLGVKTARAMKSIDTFRFTSPYEDTIRKAAELWGGTAQPWDDSRARVRNQWEVITDVDEIDIYLPPGGCSQWYEMWPGPSRRCDGVTALVPQAVGDDYELVETPCICKLNRNIECEPYTRMNILLPQLPFRGTWRLETKSYNAAVELPGVIEMIAALHQSNPIVQARLKLAKRSTVTPTGRKKNFVVPELSIVQSIHELQAGAADAAARLTTGGTGMAALNPGEPVSTSTPDVESVPVVDDVIDAEIIDDDEQAIRNVLAGDAAQFGLNPELFLRAVYRTVDARGALDDNQRDRLRRLHDRIVAEEIEPIGFGADGRVQWRKL